MSAKKMYLSRIDALWVVINFSLFIYLVMYIYCKELVTNYSFLTSHHPFSIRLNIIWITSRLLRFEMCRIETSYFSNHWANIFATIAYFLYHSFRATIYIFSITSTCSLTSKHHLHSFSKIPKITSWSCMRHA